MADSVSRIVPPSVSVDRSTGIVRERENKSRGKERKQEPPPAADAAEDMNLQDGPEDPNKGKILDINV
jgi:hypothetical protein